MKTFDDILYVKSQNSDDSGTILCALGIDGEIVYLLPTYVWFYDLIKNNSIEENIYSPENKFRVNIKNEDIVLEIIELTEELSAILRSDPDIIEITRSPLPPIESLGNLRWVSVGWNYDSNFNITPPSWWKQPGEIKHELTEEQKVELREKGYKI